VVERPVSCSGSNIRCGMDDFNSSARRLTSSAWPSASIDFSMPAVVLANLDHHNDSAFIA